MIYSKVKLNHKVCTGISTEAFDGCFNANLKEASTYSNSCQIQTTLETEIAHSNELEEFKYIRMTIVLEMKKVPTIELVGRCKI